jgi:hypothetical protein
MVVIVAIMVVIVEVVIIQFKFKKMAIIQLSGLPRSGTAFMSTVFALHPYCISLHECLLYYENPIKKIKELEKKYKYVADCSTYSYLQNFQIKEAKKIIIKRNLNESINSSSIFLNCYIDENYFNLLNDELNNFCKKNSHLSVGFNKLFNVESIKKIWEYSFGSLDFFDTNKIKNLLKLNVQINGFKNIINDEIIMKRIDEAFNYISLN